MDNQHPSPKGKVQRPSREGVHYKRLVVEVVKVFIEKNNKDCDMVCACMKVQDARSGAG